MPIDTVNCFNTLISHSAQVMIFSVEGLSSICLLSYRFNTDRIFHRPNFSQTEVDATEDFFTDASQGTNLFWLFYIGNDF